MKHLVLHSIYSQEFSFSVLLIMQYSKQYNRKNTAVEKKKKQKKNCQKDV